MNVPTAAGAIETSPWRVTRHPNSDLPSMAWIMVARAATVVLHHGSGVGVMGEGIYEGTWVGAPGAAGILTSATTFGSGVLIDAAGSLRVIPPSHLLESVYLTRVDGGLCASNSLAGVLAASGLELDPEVDYPAHFAQACDGIFRYSVPTLGAPIRVLLFDGLSIDPDGSMRDVAKPREEPFLSFADYRSRLKGALESAMANAPAFEPVATISSGYDSATVATLAVELGGRRAVTIAEGKPVRGSDRLDDSGEFVGRTLGMDVTAYPRLSYTARDDLVEADFLATGMTGEDVILSAAELELGHRMLLTGYFGDGMWWLNWPKRALMWRLEQAGLSHTEFRLRVGYIHVPLPWFGAAEMGSVEAINRDPGMLPWVLGMDNDRPIPRRILEEAGIPRGRFADAKRAPSAQIHSHGPDALSFAARSSLADFAAAEGGRVAFRRRSFPRWRRGALKVAKRLRSRRLARWAERPRREYTRHQAEFGTLLLRWAISVVRPRYGSVEELGVVKSAASDGTAK